MTEKVKITQAQADAIETIGVDYRRHDIVRQHVIGKWGEELESINHLTTDEVIKALYIGYEVEPEFLVGDWVVDEADDDKMFQLVRGSFIDSLNHGKYTVVRHATESEIAEEKERRWWESHGRKVREYRAGDVFTCHEDEICEIIEVVPSKIYSIKFKYRNGRKDAYKADAPIKIVCFAESRLDISQ